MECSVDTSLVQRKKLSPRRKSNPWPSIHRSNALTIEQVDTTSLHSPRVSVAQWVKCLTGVREVMGSIPDPDFFFVPRLWQTEYSIFLSFLFLSELKIYYLSFFMWNQFLAGKRVLLHMPLDSFRIAQFWITIHVQTVRLHGDFHSDDIPPYNKHLLTKKTYETLTSIT